MKLTLLACMMAVAVVAASPPPQAGGPNCVYPAQTDDRCNLNARVSESREAAIKAELYGVLDNVKDMVLRGDVDGFENNYMADTKYIFGANVLMGWNEIKPFLQSTIGGGGKVYTYSNIVWLIASESRAIMASGDWNLDGDTGVFVMEDWYKQDDGSWKVLYANLK